MIKLDVNSTSLLHAANSDMELESVRRLIVLVPTGMDYSTLTRRICDLARATGMPVRLLGLCRDAAEEPGLRRDLITLSALLQGARVSAETKIEIGTNWLEFVQANYRVGERIVCLSEQRTGLLHRPLGQILESNLDAPVYILSDLSSQRHTGSNWLSRVIGWTGSIGIIAGAFLLQIQIITLTKDWLQTTLLMLSVLAEIWLIWVWNSLFE